MAIKVAEVTNEDIVPRPVNVVVGPITSSEASFYTVLGKQHYRANTLMDALEMSYKLFFALSLPYPEESKIVWLLLQTIFMKITLAGEKIPSVVKKIVSYIEVASCKK